MTDPLTCHIAADGTKVKDIYHLADAQALVQPQQIIAKGARVSVPSSGATSSSNSLSNVGTSSSSGKRAGGGKKTVPHTSSSSSLKKK